MDRSVGWREYAGASVTAGETDAIHEEDSDLLYIVQPSTPQGGDYYYATWTGISGDSYYRNGADAAFRTVTGD